MYSEINEKMERARQEIARLHKIDSLLRQFQSEIALLKQKESELKAVLEKENLDVEKLKNKSIASILYSITGSLDQHIEKEQKEALAAQLKYEQALRDIEDLEYKISSLFSERLQYEESESEYRHLFQKKKELLMQDNVKAAQNILAITEELNRYKIRVKETQEAITAGNQALASLDQVLSSLNSAASWGTWDMLGGGLFADMAKHSNLDQAKNEIIYTQQLLRAFQAELSDVKISLDIRIETDGFAKFADFFFDGIFADWNMQTKINRSKDNVFMVRNQAESAIRHLNEMKASDQNSIHRLEEERNAFITNA
jgi:hypothetical protein